MIDTPSDKVFIVVSKCRDYEIRIENVTMREDLILFEHDDLYVIWGIDFLTEYHAILDCSNKAVVLKDAGRLS